jgi:hypothetical protein
LEMLWSRLACLLTFSCSRTVSVVHGPDLRAQTVISRPLCSSGT